MEQFWHKKKTSHTTHSIILIDSVYQSEKSYLQVLLEECKYTVEDKTEERYINQDLWGSCSDSEFSFEYIKTWSQFSSFCLIVVFIFCLIVFNNM